MNADKDAAAPDGLGVGPVVAPQDRPRKERRGARVVVVTADGRTLLTERFDPGLPETGWWTTPGGGVDPGEDDRSAAVRELWEETGQGVEPAQLIGPLARRVVVHGYTDQVARQTEVFFCWRVERPFDVRPQLVTERERVSTRESRWWSFAELANTPAWVWDPVAELAELAQAWDGDVVELGETELSTVPAGAV